MFRLRNFLVFTVIGLCGAVAFANPAEKIIIDTDIGDDIDDAFAIALALQSPELDILGITTTFGDTEARAAILDRMLGEVGRRAIPVAAGRATALDSSGADYFLNQKRYGQHGKFRQSSHIEAASFILDQIERHPGDVTLIAIGPLSNVGDMIDRNAATFRKVKRVVLMGGSIYAVKTNYGASSTVGPLPETNIKEDILASQKLFASGVPITVMPLDATFDLSLDEVKRRAIFSQGTELTDALTLLYHQWTNTGGVTPVLFDAMTIAYVLDSKLCPVQPMHIIVDEKGYTRVAPGKYNAEVCLHSDVNEFLQFYMRHITRREQ